MYLMITSVEYFFVFYCVINTLLFVFVSLILCLILLLFCLLIRESAKISREEHFQDKPLQFAFFVPLTILKLFFPYHMKC